MNWKSTTLTRPARPIKPVKEKSGDPSEKFAFVAASMIALDEVPRAGRALFTASGEMKKAPKKLIATETIPKMVTAEPTSVQLSIQPQKGLMMREVKT